MHHLVIYAIKLKILLFITKFFLKVAFFLLRKIKISNDMHVYFQIQGNPVPLPQWFINGNAILTRYSMLENIPSYLGNIYSIQNILLNEMKQIQFYKAKGRPPYSTSMIRFALLLCYTSPQAYCLFLEHFPLPSMSLSKQLTKGNVDKIKAAKFLLKKKMKLIRTL